MAREKDLADYYRSEYGLSLNAKDEDVLAYAEHDDPKGFATLSKAIMQTGGDPDAMVGWAEAAKRGFMGQELPKGQGVAANIAHAVGENALPTMGAIAGGAAGPAGSVAGAMAGRSVQLAGQQFLGALAPMTYNAPQQDPLQVAGDVATAGLMQAGGEALSAGAGKAYQLGKKGVVKGLAKARGLKPSDVEYAMEFPKDVFSGRTAEQTRDIYKSGITTTQPTLPGMEDTAETTTLKHFKDYMQEQTGMVDIPVAKYRKAANDASKAVLRAGDGLELKVPALTGELRNMTPQEALNGIQAINYLEYEKSTTAAKLNPKKSNLVNTGKIKAKLYDFLEKNGYPNIRDAALSAKEGSIAGKFDDVLPDIKPLTAVGIMDLGALLSGNPMASKIAAGMTVGSSPYVQGKAIQYGSPVLGALVKAARASSPYTVPASSQLMASQVRNLFKKDNAK